MANKLAMEVAGGLSNVDPSAILGSIDPRNVHVGIEHGPSGTTYNRKALPWEGAAYTNINGWTKIAGRPDAATGEELEKNYGDLTEVWSQFDRAQDERASNPGTFGALVSDLRRVAQNIGGTSGELDPELGEGSSIRARKQRAKQR